MILLNSVISSRRVLGFFVFVFFFFCIFNEESWPSSNRDGFTFFFLISIPYIYISRLFALPKTSSTMFNKSVESKRPSLVPHLRRKAFSLFPVSITLPL